MVVLFPFGLLSFPVGLYINIMECMLTGGTAFVCGLWVVIR